MKFMMNNISLILLSLGFILTVIYITIIITKNTSCNKTINNEPDLIYDERPSITYAKMFKNPEVGFGYQDFDINDNSNTASFYTKSNK
jgi:hypothetical protein